MILVISVQSPLNPDSCHKPTIHNSAAFGMGLGGRRFTTRDAPGYACIRHRVNQFDLQKYGDAMKENLSPA